MADSHLETEMRGVLAAAAGRVGLTADGARLIRLHSNALFALPTDRVLVRIATNPDALPNVAASIRLTRWLTRRGYPCTTPADIDDQPFVEAGRVVSFWQLLPTTADPPPTTADLARLLRRLHDQPPPQGLLTMFTDPFASVSAALAHTSGGLSVGQHRWLSDRIAELQSIWAALEFPRRTGLIHGDAHGNNLIRTTTGAVVLGDWDHIALGPAEWDLAQPHYTARRLGYPTPAELDTFAHTYGWEIRSWPALETLIAIREITGLAPYIRAAAGNPAKAAELTARVDSLHRGDRLASWAPPGQ